ncbi:hypothetical protein [Phocaeicola sp.]
MYTIDEKNISQYGAIPVKNNGPLAIAGIFDLPKRIGTTEYNWGTSIEPYVDAEDIELDGRTLSLKLAIKAVDYRAKLNTLRTDLLACTKLGTELGGFEVLCKDAISVDDYPKLCMAIITAKFWQPAITLPELTLMQSGKALGYSIDGYYLSSDFGVYYLEPEGVENQAKRIEVSTTATYQQTLYRELDTITFRCKMRADSLQILYTKMMQFHALCMQPGLRTLASGKISAKVYFKSGIAVTPLMDRILQFDLKCTVAEWIKR